MRKIFLDDDLKVRFPARSGDFDDGFEMGAIAALMSLKETEFTKKISAGLLDQARFLAEKLGYHVVHSDEGAEAITVTFRSRRARPRLRLVHSAVSGAAG